MIGKGNYSTLKFYNIKEKIGTGYSCKVYICESKIDKKNYAIKIFKNDISESEVNNEISLLNTINYNRVIKLIEYGKDYLISTKKSKLVNYMVFELLSSGELFEHLMFKNFPPNISVHYFKEILYMLKHFKEIKFCHRDLKPENMLFNEEFNLKLIDLGFSKFIKKNELLKTFLGTDSYLAPEILDKKKYDGYEVDLFATGIIFYIMYTGKPPFVKATRNCKYYNLIINNEFDKFWKIQKRYNPNINFTDDFKNLLEKMFQYNPKDRLTLEEILNLDYIKYNSIKPNNLKKFMNNRKNIIGLIDDKFIYNKINRKKIVRHKSLHIN